MLTLDEATLESYAMDRDVVRKPPSVRAVALHRAALGR